MSDATREVPMHDDREWIDAAARIWAPEPRSPAQRARFAATLAERRTRPERLAWAPLGAFAAAAVVVMLVVAGGQGERSDSSAAASVASGDVLVTLALDDAASVAAADESLPDDYVLLEEALGL